VDTERRRDEGIKPGDTELGRQQEAVVQRQLSYICDASSVHTIMSVDDSTTMSRSRIESVSIDGLQRFLHTQWRLCLKGLRSRGACSTCNGVVATWSSRKEW
jgi:hypothetical protein